MTSPPLGTAPGGGLFRVLGGNVSSGGRQNHWCQAAGVFFIDMGKIPDWAIKTANISNAIDASFELIYVSTEMIRSDRLKVPVLVPIVSSLSLGFELLFKTILRSNDPTYGGGHNIRSQYRQVLENFEDASKEQRWLSRVKAVKENVVTDRLMSLLETWSLGERFAAVDALRGEPRKSEKTSNPWEEVAFGEQKAFQDYVKAGGAFDARSRDERIYQAVIEVWELVVEGIKRGYCPGIPAGFAVNASFNTVQNAVGRFTIESDF